MFRINKIRKVKLENVEMLYIKKNEEIVQTFLELENLKTHN